MGYESEELIEVSYWTLLLATLPLLFLVWVSWHLNFGIEDGMIVGIIRALIQLSILGIILETIFVRGQEMWGLVLAYVIFMMTLASYESTVRSRYYFKDMFWFVLAIFAANASVVSLFAFGLLLNLDPLWDPQYVIPIVGMLLGNCINGVSLSINTLLSGVVESSREIELLLSFGASTNEASQRNVKEAIRTGSVPSLNGYVGLDLTVKEVSALFVSHSFPISLSPKNGNHWNNIHSVSTTRCFMAKLCIDTHSNRFYVVE